MKINKLHAIILIAVLFAVSMFTACEIVPTLPTPAYTVTFDSNGGTAVSNITDIAEGTTITLPTAPTKSGYDFSGWYKETTLTTAWNFSADTVTSDTTLYAKWWTIDGDLYVATTGSDGNNGSVSSPFLTITAALTAAVNGDVICIAAGTYNETIVISKTVSILGGYNADFTDRKYLTSADRENAAYKTIIQGTASTGGDYNDPMGTLRYEAGAGSDTHIIEGLVVNAPTGDATGGVAGIEIDNSSQPAIRYCTITGSPDKTPTYSYGIHVTGDAPTITNNNINGGKSNSSGQSKGLSFRTGSASPFSVTDNIIIAGDSDNGTTGMYMTGYTNNAGTVSNNSVSLGTAVSSSYYLQFSGCGIIVSDNTLTGGSVPNSYANGIYSSNHIAGMTIKNNTLDINTGASIYGIYLQGTGANLNFAQVYNNTIKLHGGSGSSWQISITAQSSVDKFYNNTIVLTGETGSVEGYRITQSDADPYFSNNLLTISGAYTTMKSIYYGSGATEGTITETHTSNNCFYVNGTDSASPGFIGVNGNIAADPLLDANLKLQVGSPAETLTGGTDFSAIFTTDKEGTTRSAPWSMGAFIAPNIPE